MCNQLLTDTSQIILVIAFITGIGCTNANNNFNSENVDESFKKALTEQQLGKSSYYISLPSNYTIKETEGEDFSVFYFYPIDTTNKAAFSGGIYFGNHPEKSEPANDSCKVEIVKGYILGNNEKWTVLNCNGRYSIQTVIESNSDEGWNELIQAFGSAFSVSEANKLLQIYSTFKMK